MDDAEIRLRCIDAAVRTVGNPNHVNQAREYYAFVTESPADTAFMEGAEEEAATNTKSNARKGTRK